MLLNLEQIDGSHEVWNRAVLASFLLMFGSFFVLYMFLIKTGTLNWPFRHMPDVAGTYQNIVRYLPIFFISMTALLWLTISDLPRLQLLPRRSWSGIFLSGMLISAGYSVYLLLTSRFEIRGPAFWPPVIILSLMNAVAEEIVFRLALYRLLQNILNRPLISNLLQAGLYALVHVPIGGIWFAGLAFLYGLLLGAMLEKERNVFPCMLCHFAVDIGNIGLPLLIQLPPGMFIR